MTDNTLRHWVEHFDGDLTIPDDLSIPAFLRIPAEVRAAAWKNRPVAVVPIKAIDYRKPKTLDAEGEAAWQAMLDAEARKKRERINQLRASKGLAPAYQEDLFA